MNKLYILISSIALFSLISCGDDILDLKPLNREGSDIYYLSDENCLKALASCYTSTADDFDLWGRGNLPTDDVIKGGNGLQDGIDFHEMASFTATSINKQVNTIWSKNFEVVTRTNELINQIVSQENPSELKMQYAAEARFLRAYAYYKLAMIFGRVPILDKVLTPADFENVKRSASEKEVIDFIVTTLDEAIPNLPEKGSVEIGHMTKGAARALKARVLMYENGFALNTVMQGRDSEYSGFDPRANWQEVYDLTLLLINDDKYDLLPNFAMIHEVEGENSIESVFELPYSADLSIAQHNQRPANSLHSRNGVRGFQGWGFNQPKDNLFEEFSRNGDIDPRRESTMLSEEWPVGWGINIVDSIMMGIRLSQYQWNIDEEGNDYTMYKSPRKGVVSKAEISHWNTNDYNLRIIRYADVLLMHAEAAYYLGKEDEAREKVNLVRERAANSTYPKGAFLGDVDEDGFPLHYKPFENANLPMISSSGTDLLEDIWHERRVELALESHRYFDLIRTGRIEKLAYTDNYLSKNGLWPIPDSEVVSWGLDQNPGY